MGALGFSVSTIFGLCTKIRQFFGFGFWFCYISLSVFGFRQNIKSDFRIYHSMRFIGVFPVSLRKICASTASTACASSLILLAVFGFRFSIIICTVLRYLTYLNGSLSNNGALLFLNARMMV